MNNNTKTPVTKDRRRAKYGSLSVAFTVVFVALIIIINAFFTSLSLSGDLAVDLTNEEFTVIGDETKTLLNSLGDDLDITIYFLAARDLFDTDSYIANGIRLLTIVRDLAESYEREFSDKIRVEYKEIGTDPAFEQKYVEEAGAALSANSIIIQGKYHYRVLALDALFEIDSETQSYYAFNGEYRMTAAILQSSISEPKLVALTTGHGETPSDSLVSILNGAGFEVENVNIAKDGISERADIVITVAPVTDFTTDEIDDMTRYLAGYKSFIVMVNASTPALPNLSSMLEDYWGIGYKANSVITDSQNAIKKDSVIKANYVILGDNAATTSAAYQVHKTVSSLQGEVTTVLPDAVELFRAESTAASAPTVETVMTTYDTAVATKDGEVVSTGKEIPIMLLSTKTAYDNDANNARRFAYVMLVASTDFASDSNLDGQYGNRRVLLASARTFGTFHVAPDISSKPFGESVLDIEIGTANIFTVLICTVVPLALVVCGVLVFLRRRHM